MTHLQIETLFPVLTVVAALAVVAHIHFGERRRFKRAEEDIRRARAATNEFIFAPLEDLTAQELAMIALKGKGIHKSYRIPSGITLESQIGAAARHFRPKEATNDAS